MGRREALIITVMLAVFSTLITAYTIAAYEVATRYIIEMGDGEAMWRTTPRGSLFPWPKGSGSLQMLSEMEDVDMFIYRYLIRDRLLMGFAILMWVLTGVFVIRARPHTLDEGERILNEGSRVIPLFYLSRSVSPRLQRSPHYGSYSRRYGLQPSYP